jgi:hypothetical protein
MPRNLNEICTVLYVHDFGFWVVLNVAVHLRLSINIYCRFEKDWMNWSFKLLANIMHFWQGSILDVKGDTLCMHVYSAVLPHPLGRLYMNSKMNNRVTED